ncbi:NifU family protein [Actinospongicola halichondriae]|uniref:NifU family protein n=1 Tax=Actinospongicola halichondriae TaxID=3236844 RepID=UPI003D3849D3
MSVTETETPEPSDEAADDGVILAVTEVAVAKVLELREAEEDASGLALRVSVTGIAGPEYTYDLTFEPLSEATDTDNVYDQGDLPVMIPADSMDALQGATLDLPGTDGQGGLVLRNPNRPDPLAGVELDLHGTTAEQVQQLLEQQINPGLAAHGGFAELKGVEGDKVYVLMGGGCQGCAVSAMTLREGIAASITSAIPEITEVIDVTDHDAGENPYYS